MKSAGLGHITRIGRGRWQATIGDYGLDKINGSVFVSGPYGSKRAAVLRVQGLRRTEIAWAGARYVVWATQPSYLSASVSLVAACLASGGRRYHF